MKSHFWYTKSQRNGILLLLALLFSVQFIFLYVDFSNEASMHSKELAQFQASLDSLKQRESAKPEITYTFNPNYITDHKGYQLGMTPDQIDLLHAFRKEGKFVNSAKEFQAITQINDSLLNLLSIKFKFPSWVGDQKNIPLKTKKTTSSTTRDLNKVTASELKTVTGLEWKMAQRIIAYRNLLKGFSLDEQLFEVYDLSQESAKQILKNFNVLDKPNIEKIDVNSSSFKSVLALPYIDYELTRRIFKYRDENGRYENIENLKKIDSFPIEKFGRIALYLSAE